MTTVVVNDCQLIGAPIMKQLVFTCEGDRTEFSDSDIRFPKALSFQSECMVSVSLVAGEEGTFTYEGVFVASS